jgi:hypothetical protein
MHATARDELEQLKNLLDAWASTPDSVRRLSVWRQHGCAGLQASLPARYLTALTGLIDRLEASALFAEESCSFSQKDLLDSLRTWIAHADKALG